MQSRFLVPLVFMCGPLVVAGCASSGKKTPKEVTLLAAGEKPASEGSIPSEQVGIVKLVNAQTGFVLIEGRVSEMPPDLTLKSFEPSANPVPEMQTAVLKAGVERASRFVAADIISGQPSKGDAVYR